MKASVDLKTPAGAENNLPFIGINNFSAAVILFTADTPTPRSSFVTEMIKGIILEPGVSDHSVGQWVTYQRKDVKPLVGTITLEN